MHCDQRTHFDCLVLIHFEFQTVWNQREFFSKNFFVLFLNSNGHKKKNYNGRTCIIIGLGTERNHNGIQPNVLFLASAVVCSLVILLQIITAKSKQACRKNSWTAWLPDYWQFIWFNGIITQWVQSFLFSRREFFFWFFLVLFLLFFPHESKVCSFSTEMSN